MTTRKKIIFEGQDLGLSTTMQRLQRQAEGMSTSVLNRYAQTVKSSKELNKLMQEEFRNSQQLSRISFDDKRYQAIERYNRKLEEINRKEEQHFNKLRASGLSGTELDSRMRDASGKFQSRREAAGTVRDESIQKLKESLEEQKKTNQLLQQIFSEDKKQWEQEFRENKRGVETFLTNSRKQGLENLSEEDRAKYSYQNLLMSEPQTESGRGKGSVLRDIIGAGIIRDIGGVISQMPNVGDAYDLIPGLSRIFGAAGGAVIGGGVGAIAGLTQTGTGGTAAGPSAVTGATLGAEIGQRAGDFAGAAMMRHFNELENLERSRLGYKALTGNSYGVNFDFSRFGFSQAEGYATAQQMARASGSKQNDVFSLLGAQTGFNIEQGSLMSLVRSSRRTGGDFGQEMENLIGIAQSAGIDRVLLNEFVQNQSQLIESIGSMTEKVDPRNTAALLLELNTLSGGSGGFSARDPRTMGYISSLQSGLSSPNDFGRAMNFSVLRNMNPNGSLLDMLEAEEQGLGGERGRDFLKGTIEQYSQMFGDEDLTILALRSRFPGIPIADLRKLIKGQDVLGSMETAQMTQTTDVTKEGNVAMRAQLQAAVTDAFTSGPIEGLLKVEEQLGDLFQRVLQHASSKLDVKKIVSDSIKEATGVRTNDPNK